MAWLLNEIYEGFVEKLVNKDKAQISYTNWNWNHVEYTEWYAFREWGFRDRVNETLEKPFFKYIFILTLNAFLSASNEENFLDLLDRYLSVFLSKKLLKEWEDEYEKKTYIRSDLDFVNDEYLKQRLLLENWDWKKYDNSPLSIKDNNSIYTYVDYIYDKIKKEILSKY